MNFQENQIYHIYNQGNNKGIVFFREKNYLFFLIKMRKILTPYLDFLAYCLMPNHFHWLIITKPEGCQLSKAIKPVKPSEKSEKASEVMTSSHHLTTTTDMHYQQNLSHAISVLLRSYTRAINRQENRTGSLFRKQTKFKDGFLDGFITLGTKHEHLLFRPDNDYARRCFEYIHQNPVKSGLVKNSEDWRYSSAQDYAGLRTGTLCNQKRANELLFS